MAVYTLSNNLLTCQINERGAELNSLVSTTHHQEYIWQADPAIWAGSAPILFPVVGRLNGGEYRYQGKDYAIPIHGFAREQCFNLHRKTATSLTLRLQDNSKTWQFYPFKFQLDVTFSLMQNRLLVLYQVKNTGQTNLYFTLGSHPAFSLPSAAFNDEKCSLLFSEKENSFCHLIKGNLLSKQLYPVAFNGRKLILDANIFDHDALIFRNINSSQVTLLVDEQPRLSLDIGANKHLGLWAKPNAPYVCIEPWLATDEHQDSPKALEEKPDYCCLAAEEVFSNDYQITIY